MAVVILLLMFLLLEAATDFDYSCLISQPLLIALSPPANLRAGSSLLNVQPLSPYRASVGPSLYFRTGPDQGPDQAHGQIHCTVGK